MRSFEKPMPAKSDEHHALMSIADVKKSAWGGGLARSARRAPHEISTAKFASSTRRIVRNTRRGEHKPGRLQVRVSGGEFGNRSSCLTRADWQFRVRSSAFMRFGLAHSCPDRINAELQTLQRSARWFARNLVCMRLKVWSFVPRSCGTVQGTEFRIYAARPGSRLPGPRKRGTPNLPPLTLSDLSRLDWRSDFREKAAM